MFIQKTLCIHCASYFSLYISCTDRSSIKDFFVYIYLQKFIVQLKRSLCFTLYFAYSTEISNKHDFRVCIMTPWRERELFSVEDLNVSLPSVMHAHWTITETQNFRGILEIKLHSQQCLYSQFVLQIIWIRLIVYCMIYVVCL